MGWVEHTRGGVVRDLVLVRGGVVTGCGGVDSELDRIRLGFIL